MDLLKTSPGNGSVNMFQHTHAVNNTVEVFPIDSVPCNSRRAVFYVVGARNSRKAMFSTWSMLRLYNRSLFLTLISTESRTKGMGIQLNEGRIGRIGSNSGSRQSEEVDCAKTLNVL
jgi:hypothetical protein